MSSDWRGGMRLLLDEDLRGHGLDLGQHVGLDELLEVDASKVVDQAKVEAAKVEATKVKAVEETSTSDREDGVELLELEEGVDVKDLLLEQVLELENVQVVLQAEGTEELEVQSVDVEEVVQVDLVEAVEVVELGEVESGALLNFGAGGGSGDQSGQGGDDHGRELHFAGVWE